MHSAQLLLTRILSQSAHSTAAMMVQSAHYCLNQFYLVSLQGFERSAACMIYTTITDPLLQPYTSTTTHYKVTKSLLFVLHYTPEASSLFAYAQ
jgi:hypothetical protein